MHGRSVNTLFLFLKFQSFAFLISSQTSFIGKLSTFCLSSLTSFQETLHPIQSARNVHQHGMHTHRGKKLDVLSDLLGISLSTQGDSGHESRK